MPSAPSTPPVQLAENQQTAQSAQILPGTSIRYAPKTVKDCIKCTAPLGTSNQYVRCYLCLIPQHIGCISNAITAGSVKDCKSNDKQVHFFCMECEQNASQLKPAERQQIIDYKTQIKNISEEIKTKLKAAAEQEDVFKKKCYDLTELHNDAVRQLNSLRSSYEMVQTELKVLNENIQVTVAQQSSEIVTQNAALINENDSLRKIIDENKSAYENEIKRLQGENLMYIKSAAKGDDRIKELKATIKELQDNASKSKTTFGNRSKRPRSDSMEIDMVDDTHVASEKSVQPLPRLSHHKIHKSIVSETFKLPTAPNLRIFKTKFWEMNV